MQDEHLVQLRVQLRRRFDVRVDHEHVVRRHDDLGSRVPAVLLRAPERLHHLLRLRDHQDSTGGFLAFVPLAFHPENTVFERRGFRFTTGADDLKVIAVSRLLLDNIPNVKAYWIMMGLPLAQVALHFGANDVQGTVVREEIFHAAGARTETEQKIPELVRFVTAAGRIPVQRDTLYNELHRWA